MNDQLRTLIRDAGTIAQDARSSFGALSAAQLNWKPSAERWSVAQCFVHLIESNKGYLPIIESVRRGTKKTRFRERLPMLPGLAGRLLIKSLDPANTRKMKAPKAFEPSQSFSREVYPRDCGGGFSREVYPRDCGRFQQRSFNANRLRHPMVWITRAASPPDVRRGYASPY
jgi:DinB family protein